MQIQHSTKKTIKYICLILYLSIAFWYFATLLFNLGFTNNIELERSLLFVALEVINGAILIAIITWKIKR